MDEKIKKIYGISCKDVNCYDCKIKYCGKDEFCPKSYADDYMEATRLLEESEKMIKLIANRI